MYERRDNTVAAARVASYAAPLAVFPQRRFLVSAMRLSLRTLSCFFVGLLCACIQGGDGTAPDDERGPGPGLDGSSGGGDGSTDRSGDGGGSGGADMSSTVPHGYDGGAWGSVTQLDSTGGADEPAVAMDDDANALVLWSQAANTKTDRRIWMRGHTPAGFTPARILREHAKTPAVALAGHGYGAWSALQQVFPMNDSPYDSITAALFRVGTDVTMTDPREAVWGLKAPYEKSFSAPYAAVNATGAGALEYFITDTVTTTKWSRPFQVGATGGGWQTSAASTSGGWAVIDGAGTLASAWNENTTHARYTKVAGMGGSQTPRVQDSDTRFRATPPSYRTSRGGLGVLGYSRPASTSTLEVVASRWAPAAVIGTPDRVTVLPAGQSVVGHDVAIDRNGNAFAAWLERAGSETILKASRAPVGGAWDAPVELRRNARMGLVRVGTDLNGDALLVWDEIDASGKANALAFSTWRPGEGYLTPAVIASGIGNGADKFVLATGGDASAVAVWSDAQHIYAIAYRGSPGCPAGQVACGGACKDPETDVHHCGVCTNACPAPKDHGATCTAGVCGVR